MVEENFLLICLPLQIVRGAVLDLIGTLVVANAVFTHTCLQLLVYNFIPPPAPPSPDSEQGEWRVTEEARSVQESVLSTLEKARLTCLLSSTLSSILIMHSCIFMGLILPLDLLCR
jgi:hypothetical protein